MPSYTNSFEIEATGVDEENRKVTVRALRQVNLYELAEGIYDFMSQDREFRYDLHISEVEFTSSGGNYYKFIQHACWLNPGTILSDISRQLKI